LRIYLSFFWNLDHADTLFLLTAGIYILRGDRSYQYRQFLDIFILNA